MYTYTYGLVWQKRFLSFYLLTGAAEEWLIVYNLSIWMITMQQCQWSSTDY